MEQTMEATMEEPQQRVGVPEARLHRITPQTARVWLKHNNDNYRKIREGYVLQLADSMRRGEWIITGDAIKFDRNGNLIDGQHRLLAVIESGVDIEAFVITQIENAAQEVMDSGRGRTLADRLRRRGEKYYSELSSTLRLLTLMKHAGTFREPWAQYTHLQMINLLEEHPDIRDFYIKQDLKKIKYPIGLGWALYYLFAQVDEEDARVFFERLTTGLDLTDPADPILKLRELVIKFSQLPPGQRIEVFVVGALTIKAWNAWRRGQDVHQLRWRAGGRHREAYPRIEGLEDTAWYQSIDSALEESGQRPRNNKWRKVARGEMPPELK